MNYIFPLLLIFTIVLGAVLCVLYFRLLSRTKKSINALKDKEMKIEKLKEKQSNKNEEVVSKIEVERPLEQPIVIAFNKPNEKAVKKEEQMKIKENEKEKLEEVYYYENEESGRRETTVIGSGTSIFGDIKTDSDLEIYGSVEGNIECNAQLKILGKIVGNISTGDLYLDNAEIIGNLNCSRDFENTEYTAITGDIRARVAKIGGRVNGNVLIEDALILDEHAVIVGDITAGTIEIHRGAVINGSMNIIQSELNSWE